VNIEEERTLKSQLPESTFVDGRTSCGSRAQAQSSRHLRANFKKYELALRQLSWVLTFFQAHPGFNRDQHPSLDPRIDKLTAELLSLTYEQLNQLWAVIGGKQLRRSCTACASSPCRTSSPLHQRRSPRSPRRAIVHDHQLQVLCTFEIGHTYYGGLSQDFLFVMRIPMRRCCDAVA